MEIDKKEYIAGQLAQIKMAMLEAGGVDNWQWYSESLSPEGEESYWDIKERLTKEMNS